MGAVDNQINWRKVFQDNAADLKCMTTPDGITAQPVNQAMAASLKCMNTPDGVTSQPVHQGDATLLKMTNTPDGVNSQLVHFGGMVQGIWPPEGSLRINKANTVAGVAVSIIYTVPANKKLFISSGDLASLSDAPATGVVRMGVRNGADALQYWMMYHYYQIEGQQVHSSRYVPALEAEADWDVFVEGRAAVVAARGFLFGWLEDA